MLWDCLIIVATLSNGHPGLVRHCVYAGIVDCVVAIMNQHPGHETLQSFCLLAIHRFITGEHNGSKQLVIGATTTTTSYCTDNNSGLNANIKAMKKFPERCRLQHLGSQILYKISYEDLAERIVDAGAIGVLAAAVERSYDNYDGAPSIKTFARHAMKKLI